MGNDVIEQLYFGNLIPESVKLDYQIMLSRQRYFAKASNYTKQVTNSENGRKKPIPLTEDVFTCSVVAASMRLQIATRFAGMQIARYCFAQAPSHTLLRVRSHGWHSE